MEWTGLAKVAIVLAAAAFAVGFWWWRRDVRSTTRATWALSSLLFAVLVGPLCGLLFALAGENAAPSFLVPLALWLWVLCYQGTRVTLRPLDLSFVPMGRLVARAAGTGAVAGFLFLLGASLVGAFATVAWIGILVLGFLPALVIGALVGGVYALAAIPIIEVARPESR